MPAKTNKVTKAKSTGKDVKKQVTASSRAGVVFPVGRLRTYMKKLKVAKNVGAGSAVYMAAVLEYMTAELLELAGNYTTHHKKKTINPRAIFMGIKQDAELDLLLADSMVSGGGVKEFVDPRLRQGKAKKDYEAETKTMKTGAA